MTDENYGPMTDVDSDAEKATEYLDTVSGLDIFQAYKRRSHNLLQLEEGDQVLDIGCGAGDDVLMLAKHVGSNGSVIGIDKSESLIEEAKARAGDTTAISFRIDDVMALSFEDGTVNGCRADRVFQHLENPLGALLEMRRVTIGGGRIVVSDADWGTFTIAAPETETELTEAVTDTQQAEAVSPTVGRRLYTTFREAGLTDVEIDPINFIFTDFETVNEVTFLEDRLKKLIDEGKTSPDEADRWLETLRQADQDGTLFCSVLGYTVGGTVPE